LIKTSNSSAMIIVFKTSISGFSKNTSTIRKTNQRVSERSFIISQFFCKSFALGMAYL